MDSFEKPLITIPVVTHISSSSPKSVMSIGRKGDGGWRERERERDRQREVESYQIQEGRVSNCKRNRERMDECVLLRKMCVCDSKVESVCGSVSTNGCT